MTRKELLEELRQLEDRPSGLVDYSNEMAVRDRIQEICRLLNEVICRECGKHYDNYKSRAEYTGFCSAKCLHAKAKRLGYRKNGKPSEYCVLQRVNQVGSVYVLK